MTDQQQQQQQLAVEHGYQMTCKFTVIDKYLVYIYDLLPKFLNTIS